MITSLRRQLDSPLIAFFLLTMLYYYSTILAFFVCAVAIVMLCRRYWRGEIGVVYLLLLTAFFVLYGAQGAVLFWYA